MPTTDKQKVEGWVSITEVLDSYQEQGIIDWKIKVGKKEAKRISTIATKIGTRVHELIYQDWKDGKYKLSAKDPIEVKNCLSAWEQFKTDYKPTILSMEEEVVDEVKLVVGHRDMIANIGESTVLLDIKTSSQVNPKNWLQVSKYSELSQLEDKVGILRLDKNLGVYEYQERLFDYGLVEVFNNMVAVYRYFNPNGEQEGDANGNDTDDSITDRGF